MARITKRMYEKVVGKFLEALGSRDRKWQTATLQLLTALWMADQMGQGNIVLSVPKRRRDKLHERLRRNKSDEIILLLKAGVSAAEIHRQTGASLGTIAYHKKKLKESA